MGYGLLQVWVIDIGISYPQNWWIQNAMGYWRLWVITVWVISGLTVYKHFYLPYKVKGIATINMFFLIITHVTTAVSLIAA